MTIQSERARTDREIQGTMEDLKNVISEFLESSKDVTVSMARMNVELEEIRSSNEKLRKLVIEGGDGSSPIIARLMLAEKGLAECLARFESVEQGIMSKVDSKILITKMSEEKRDLERTLDDSRNINVESKKEAKAKRDRAMTLIAIILATASLLFEVVWKFISGDKG